MKGTVSAIVPAAGVGKRLPGDEPKQFRLLGDMPVLAWSVRGLAAADGVVEVIVGAGEDRIEQVRKLLDATVSFDGCKVVAGGAERQETVRRCLAEVRADAEIIVIHDAVRPFVSPSLVEKVIEAAAGAVAASAGVRPSDTIKFVLPTGGGRNLDRSRLWQIQTPQAFKKNLIKEAHSLAVEDGFKSTDDTALVDERLGVTVKIVEGEKLNFKITTEADWEMASALVAAGAVRPARIP